MDVFAGLVEHKSLHVKCFAGISVAPGRQLRLPGRQLRQAQQKSSGDYDDGAMNSSLSTSTTVESGNIVHASFLITDDADALCYGELVSSQKFTQ